MKRNLLFLGSVFAMLLLLAMWIFTVNGHTNGCHYAVDWKVKPVVFKTTSCRTLYGNGKDVQEDENWDWSTYSKQIGWTQLFLPPTNLGWMLFVLACLQWFFLKRDFRAKTKRFAIGVEPSDIGKQIHSTFKPGGFIYDLIYFKFFVYFQVGLAVLIFISNTLSVVISKQLKYDMFTDGIPFESLQLNIEYVFPGVLYLAATIISIYCLNKYIKTCQSE